jgi:hypothetical protein
MIIDLSREAARVLRQSPSLRRQYSDLAETILRGLVVNGRWEFAVTAAAAIDLRMWCNAQADALRTSDVTTAELLDRAAADITAAIGVVKP